MKKSRFFLMSLLLVTVLTFTGCSSRDDDHDAIPDDQETRTERDAGDDVNDDAGDDAEDAADDAIDDIEDGADDITGR